MTDLTARSETRAFHFRTGGNDDNDGTTYNQANAMPEVALASCLALDPPPSFGSTAAVINLGAGEFNAQLTSMSSIFLIAGSTSFNEVADGEYVLSLGSLTNADVATITNNSTENGRAVICDGQVRTALNYKFLAARGSGVPVSFEVNGASDNVVSKGGQISAWENGVGLQDVAPDTTVCVHQANIISLDGDNSVGAIVGGAGAVKELEFNSIAKSEPVVIPPDPPLPPFVNTTGLKGNGGEVTVRGSRITAENGIVLPDGSASEWTVDVSCVNGDIFVGDNCILDAAIIKHPGQILGTGQINGKINGVRYGWDVIDDKYVATFFRPGFVSAGFDDFGWITLNGLTDVVSSILVSYQQGTNQNRVVDFQLVDAVSGDVYFSGSNTSAGQGPKSFSGAVVGVALPSVATLCKVQAKDNGSQITDIGASVYFTRTLPSP